MNYRAWLLPLSVSLLGACGVQEPVVTIETNLTLNGTRATCAQLGAEAIHVRLAERTDDGEGDAYRLEFRCGEPAPRIAVPAGGWTLSAELLHADGIQRHTIPQTWLLVDDVDTQTVAIDFDYATFAVNWSLAIDGRATDCAELGSDEISVEYASHEGTRVQTFPCVAGAGISVAMPRSKLYSVYAELTHPSQVYPTVWQRRRLTEPVGTTPLPMVFDVTAAQVGP